MQSDLRNKWREALDCLLNLPKKAFFQSYTDPYTITPDAFFLHIADESHKGRTYMENQYARILKLFKSKEGPQGSKELILRSVGEYLYKDWLKWKNSDEAVQFWRHRAAQVYVSTVESKVKEQQEHVLEYYTESVKSQFPVTTAESTATRSSALPSSPLGNGAIHDTSAQDRERVTAFAPNEPAADRLRAHITATSRRSSSSSKQSYAPEPEASSAIQTPVPSLNQPRTHAPVTSGSSRTWMSSYTHAAAPAASTQTATATATTSLATATKKATPTITSPLKRSQVGAESRVGRKRKPRSLFKVDLDPVLSAPCSSEDAYCGDYNITATFKKLQQDSSKVVNASTTMELEHLHYFLAVNSIWDMRSALPGMPSAVHAEICAKFESRFPLEDVSAAELALHLDLENELRKCGELTTAHSDVSQNPILSVWKRLSENLKRTWNSATDCKGEDTHVHHRLGPFVAPVFPGKDFEVIWANKQIEGSQARREDCGREGYRPDLVIKKKGLAFLISEVKPPEHDDNVDDYVADLWKLVILMKDQIDHELDGGAEKTFMFGLHVFGYKADLWVMDLELEGIYHLYHVGEACLPRYQRDTGGVRYVTQLFFSIKSFVENNIIGPILPPGLRTPPTKASYKRPTIFTPSKREKE